MPRGLARIRMLVVLAFVVACGSSSASPAASPTVTTPSGTAVSSGAPTDSPPAPTEAAPASAPPEAPTGVANTMAAPPVAARLPVKTGSGRVLLTTMPGGGLLLLIPTTPTRDAPFGAVMTFLQPSGEAEPGWPIGLPGERDCGAPVLVSDSSLRVVCSGADTVVYGVTQQGRSLYGWPITVGEGRCEVEVLAAPDASIRLLCGESYRTAYAIDGRGRTMPGWPVSLTADQFSGPDEAGGAEPRVTGGEVVAIAQQWDEAANAYHVRLVEINAAGVVRVGRALTTDAEDTVIGPDGTAYRVGDGQMVAFDTDGIRPGWPVSFEGLPSTPAFGDDGRIYVTVGTMRDDSEQTSRVIAYDVAGAQVAASPELGIATADPGVDCVTGPPEPPTLAADGSAYVWKTGEASIYALDPDLRVRPGWPFQQPEGAPIDACAGAEGLCCDWRFSTPRAVGGDGSLYLVLERARSKVGESVAAFGRDGRVRSGWPVVLRNPRAAFEEVVVGGDQTVYAVATEPEAGDRWSSTLLAINADSSIRFRVTVVDP